MTAPAELKQLLADRDWRMNNLYRITNKAGESYVSYADYAIAMIDEAADRSYVGRRFTVVSERQ